MRLLWITNLYPPASFGGYEEICYDIAEALKGRGHDVFVLTSSFRAEQIQTEEERVYRLLKVMSNWGVAEAGPTPWVADNRLDAEWHNFRTVRRVVRDVHSDAVVIWNGSNMGRALLSALGPPVRSIFYLFDTWLALELAAQRQTGTTRKRLLRILLTVLGSPIAPIQSEALIFCSRALMSEYQQIGAETKGSEVIYPALPGAVFFPREPRILHTAFGGSRRILYSGRIAPEKGIMTLIRALAKVREVSGLENTRLSMVGVIQYEGWAVQLYELIKALDLDGVIDFVAHQPRAELPAMFAQHDVLVFPSEWEEPFGLSLLEAMAVGLPVVTSLRGGPAEFAFDWDNARTFEAGNSDDLAQKLIWVLTHPRDAAALGQCASSHVQKNFNLETQVGLLEGYLESRLSRMTVRERIAASQWPS